MNAEHSCNCIFSMVNDSFACNHYHFMKMSNVDRFIECIWHKHCKNLDFIPKFGAEMQFNLLHPKRSCNCIFSMANDSLACNHYPSMKTSNLDGFKRHILRKHPQNSRFYPGFGAKCNLFYPNAPQTLM